MASLIECAAIGLRIFKTKTPQELVALLGIAQRQIRLQFSHKLRKPQHAKPLADSIKTLGDWIRVKRQEKKPYTRALGGKNGYCISFGSLLGTWPVASDRSPMAALGRHSGLGFYIRKMLNIIPRVRCWLLHTFRVLYRERDLIARVQCWVLHTFGRLEKTLWFAWKGLFPALFSFFSERFTLFHPYSI